MTGTLIANMLVPDVWAKYVTQKTVEKSALFQSGIATDLTINPEIAGALNSGGVTVQLPFFADLSGNDNVFVDTADITINNVTTGKDIAPILMREKTFGASDLSAELSGADPMGMIGDRFADYWARMYQKALINELAGTMAQVSANVLDISALTGGAQIFDGEAVIDACALLGDNQDILSGMAVHSNTYALMKKQDLIDFIPDSQGNPTIPTYMGKRLVVDDSMPVTSGTYTSYIFAQGAVGYAEVTPKNGAEAGRDPLKNGGMDYIINRKKLVMHTRGIKWVGTPAASTPTNAELATSGNWTLVYNQKDIRVIQFKHKNA